MTMIADSRTVERFSLPPLFRAPRSLTLLAFQISFSFQFFLYNSHECEIFVVKSVKLCGAIAGSRLGGPADLSVLSPAAPTLVQGRSSGYKVSFSASSRIGK